MNLGEAAWTGADTRRSSLARVSYIFARSAFMAEEAEEKSQGYKVTVKQV